ncbi:16S rRNA (cytosine(1402)-N(4))-methyltransferase RsmH [Candidatus Latescibacterota bacterium]
MSNTYHIPVMLSEVIDFFRVKEGGLYVDCTLGGGGHSLAILEMGGAVIGIDRDKEAVAYATKRLIGFGELFKAYVSLFSRICEIVSNDVGLVDGVIMDLGVSSKMIDDPSRGFSYRENGPLLMTMNQGSETAFHVVNTKSTQVLSKIFKEFGEERHAVRIARAICDARSIHPIETTLELAEIIEKAVGRRMPQKSKARIFQALRIYVNDEIGELHRGLNSAVDVLRPGGRLCVMSYHSLEDRFVKDFLKTMADPCVCPPGMPVCACGKKPALKVITRKPVKPGQDEVKRNPRSRSALLRVGEKIEVP